MLHHGTATPTPVRSAEWDRVGPSTGSGRVEWSGVGLSGAEYGGVAAWVKRHTETHRNTQRDTDAHTDREM